MLRAEGIAGQIEVDEAFLTIKRQGARAMLNHGLKGDKRIPLQNITAVQFKPAGLTAGYIQLSIAGGVESKAGLLASGNDENSMQFKSRQQAAFEAIRDHVESAIRMRPSAAVGSAPASAADELRKLAALLQEGLLTQAEFDVQKARLLT